MIRIQLRRDKNTILECRLPNGANIVSIARYGKLILFWFGRRPSIAIGGAR